MLKHHQRLSNTCLHHLMAFIENNQLDKMWNSTENIRQQNYTNDLKCGWGLKTPKFTSLQSIRFPNTSHPWHWPHMNTRGGSRISMGGGGGGGGKRLCARTHITSAKPEVPNTAGVQGLLKGPGSSTVEILSRAIGPLFLSFLIQIVWKNTHINDHIFFFGGGGLLPPLDPPLSVCERMIWEWILRICISSYSQSCKQVGVELEHMWRETGWFTIDGFLYRYDWLWHAHF